MLNSSTGVNVHPMLYTVNNMFNLFKRSKRSEFTNEEDLIMENLHYLLNGDFTDNTRVLIEASGLKSTNMFNDETIDRMVTIIINDNTK